MPSSNREIDQYKRSIDRIHCSRGLSRCLGRIFDRIFDRKSIVFIYREKETDVNHCMTSIVFTLHELQK